MTAPDGASPAGSLAVGLFHALQTKTVDEAKAAMSGGIMGAVDDAEAQLDDEVKTPLAGKPDIEEVPIDSTMWQTMNPREQSTFPRSQIVQLVNTSTGSGGSGTAAHTHTVSQFAKIPDYQPSGNGTDFLEIGYIRISKNCSFTHAGFITGDSATFAGVGGAYLGVFKMETSGNLTLLNTSTATLNLQSSITTQNTEHIFNLGITHAALQNEVYAVGILQDTNAFQSAASMLAIRISDLTRDASSVYPRKAYCYAGTYASIPSSITESSLNYTASTKLPFFYVREV